MAVAKSVVRTIALREDQANRLQDVLVSARADRGQDRHLPDRASARRVGVFELYPSFEAFAVSGLGIRAEFLY